jgi:hypothetical protein
LGLLPKSQKWNDLVEQVVGTRLASTFVPAEFYVGKIAAKTLEASQTSLAKAPRDSGVAYTFYLLTQIALASRSNDWERNLARHGIRLTPDSTVFDLTIEVQSAVDRHVGRGSGATDLSEMAQQSAGEALAGLVGSQAGLFATSGADVKHAIRSLSTKKGFGELGQRFFGRFVARFLNFYLSRATAAAVGTRRLRDLGDVAQFDDALLTHCDQSARIVRDFCGDWYSKTSYREGINLRNTSRFLAVAVKKLRAELKQQGSES